MQEGTLASALEREHRDIDGGIEDYSSRLSDGINEPEPLLRAMAALRRHIYLEEEFLFPPLKEAGMTMPIFVMLKEHGELWRAMAALDTLLATETDSETVLNACRELLTQLDKHNSKEEPIIYPQADAILSGEASTGLSAFVASGTMPEGWACEKADAAASGPAAPPWA